MKIVDKLLIKSFIPPFVLASFIALFVLIMQTLWLYIDDILGKGASLFVVLEFLFYLSMSLVPMAMPIGVLLASVMLFGTMAEKFELSSLKSSGVPLIRIMRPLIFLTLLISLSSYLCYDYVIPYSNLKFKSRLYDLRKQKPSLSLQEKVFNEDFKGINIYIKSKNSETNEIREVIIYDGDKSAGKAKSNIITAKRGEMYNSPFGDYFVMILYDGYIYQDMKKESKSQSSNYPFMRTEFKKWTKVFDLSEFDLDRTDEELFKSHQTMKNSGELRVDIDSLENKIITIGNDNYKDLIKILNSQVSSKDSLSNNSLNNQIGRKQHAENKEKMLLEKDISMDTIKSLIEFVPLDKRPILAKKLSKKIENRRYHTQTLRKNRNRVFKKLVAHKYELNIKYSFAAICLVFLFIGAPMGAIVKKGGFGYPLLIAIFFFIIFFLTVIFCKKLMQSGSIGPVYAAWIPVFVMIPFGVVLTYKAMMDSQFAILNSIGSWLKSLIKRTNDES